MSTVLLVQSYLFKLFQQFILLPVILLFINFIKLESQLKGHEPLLDCPFIRGLFFDNLIDFFGDKDEAVQWCEEYVVKNKNVTLL